MPFKSRSKVTVEDFRQSTCYKAIQLIRDKKAGPTWVKYEVECLPDFMESPALKSISILSPDPDFIPERRWFGLRPGRERRAELCEIYFDNPTRDADPGHWVVEAYGERTLVLTQQLLKELSEKLNAQVRIVLSSIDPRHEALDSDRFGE